MKNVKTTEKRVAMSYEFEDLLRQLRSKKDKSQQQTESQRMSKLNQILSQSVNTFELNIKGNHCTKYDFLAQELNITTPNTIENCSIEIFDGINRLKEELDLIDTANAMIDIDPTDPSKLLCDLDIAEKNRLTATIGASHDVQSMSQLNGSLSVGIRNLFGHGEKLDLAADLGLGTGNKSPSFGSDYSGNAPDLVSSDPMDKTESNSIYNMVHNTSNQYSITFNKPRVSLPFNVLSPFDADECKSNLILKGFQQKLDRTRSSGYDEDSLGSTASLISYNKQHCLSYHCHLRTLIPNLNKKGRMVSPSVLDESTMMSTKSSLQYRFVKDTRNHASIPSEGYLMTMETECAGIGGDADFVKTFGSFYYHWALPRVTTNVDPPDVTTRFRSILNIGFQAGFVVPWKQKLIGSIRNDGAKRYGDNHVRIIDRIIPFGGLLLRGFEHAQIGPKDNKDYVHSDVLLSGGISLAVPFFEWLYGNVFCNALYCDLLRNVSSFEQNLNANLSASAGVSMIVPFPVGRLEIGYAYPLRNKNNPFSPWFWAFDVNFF
eukprot:191683_1